MSKSEVFRQEVSIDILTPHPLNIKIYGEQEDVSSLAKSIEISQWVKPLVVTKDYVIVSGHRRWKALQQLGWLTAPVEIQEFTDEVAILEALLLENVTREKTLEMRIREGMAWESIEAEKATSRKGTRTDLGNMVENFPPCSPRTKFGKSRDAIGSRISLSGKSYAKGRKVVDLIDSEAREGNLSSASTLRTALDKSIDAAYKLAIKPKNTREAIAQMLKTGKVKNITTAIRLANQQSETQSLPLTPSCWNCGHRGEQINNHSIYCYKLGLLDLVDKSGEERGQNCSEWTDLTLSSPLQKKTTFVLSLLLPIEWQTQLEEIAATVGLDPATWVKHLIDANLHLHPELAQMAQIQSNWVGMNKASRQN
ncbi:ParB N-terminal domain-containing protein [Planktothrix sp. FACHB-1365]|uniref:ParB/RepB/Spo0J family partition protein n=1 Tax=Planktothrix sp. FACHB-1365 TaxID=2692855 RepID=UPI001F5505D6|nr:ParB N-terminal domain-containing protein [Planktothrix sp. FACHB-1365]